MIQTQPRMRMRTPTHHFTVPAPMGMSMLLRCCLRPMPGWMQGNTLRGVLVFLNIRVLVFLNITLSVWLRNASLWTPVDCASAGGWPEIVELLADAQADVCTSDKPNKVSDLGQLCHIPIGAPSVGNTPPPGMQRRQCAGSGDPDTEWSKCGCIEPGWFELSGSGHRERTNVRVFCSVFMCVQVACCAHVLFSIAAFLMLALVALCEVFCFVF